MEFFSLDNLKPYTQKDTFDEYLNQKFVSSSDLPHLAISPLHYKNYKDSKSKESESQELGSALHKLVLEPESFNSTYKIILTEDLPNPDKDFRNTENKTYKDNFITEWSSKGYHVLLPDEGDKIVGMANSLLNTTKLPDLLGGSIPELSHYTYNEKFSLPVKLRPDLISPDRFMYLSLKTTSKPLAQFEFEADKYGYFYKEAFYYDHLKQFYAGKWDLKWCIMAVVESIPPHYYSTLFWLDSDYLEAGKDHYMTYLWRLRNALDSNVWQGYDYHSEDNNGLVRLRLPYRATIIPTK